MQILVVNAGSHIVKLRVIGDGDELLDARDLGLTDRTLVVEAREDLQIAQKCRQVMATKSAKGD